MTGVLIVEDGRLTLRESLATVPDRSAGIVRSVAANQADVRAC
jgi:hypothetical protein